MQNARDRRAELARGRYGDWREAAHRLERALDSIHWPAPGANAVAAGWKEPLECPHADLPGMFEVRGIRGVRVCVNCGEMRLTREGVQIRVQQSSRTDLPRRRRWGLDETVDEAVRRRVIIPRAALLARMEEEAGNNPDRRSRPPPDGAGLGGIPDRDG